MTSEAQFKPIKNPGAEPEKIFTSARLREIHGRHQPQPFLNTALGKLPPEIRVMIYQYLVVGQETDPSATMSRLLAASPSIASQRFIYLRRSGLSILRTCRQINLEAHSIFDASGIPYFANAGELAGFLKGVGPIGRLQLEAFRIGSLVSHEPFEVHQHHYYDPRIFYLHSNGYISYRYKKIDPDVTSAFSLLFECKNLRTIYMEMKQGEEIMHYNILRSFIAGLVTILRVYDLHYWYALRSEKPIHEYGVLDLNSPWRIYQALVSSGRLMGRDVLVMVDMNPSPSRQPFPKTRLGKLPQKLRTQIYHELVAIPPIHTSRRPSTRDLRAGKGDLDRALTPPTTFVHLQASCFKVLRICRQMYVEAHPIFYSRGSFYTHDMKELVQLGRHLGIRSFSQSSLRKTMVLNSTVTSLCVKNLVSWSEEKGHYLKDTDFGSVYQLRRWNNLQKLCLCMRAGEELGYLEYLFLLPRMNHSVVEFLNDSHWVLLRQCPQEEWQIQYACFETNVLGYRRGKGNVELSLEDIEVQRRILKVHSSATELNQGDERYVEVDIGGTSKARMLSGMKELIERFERLSLDH